MIVRLWVRPRRPLQSRRVESRPTARCRTQSESGIFQRPDLAFRARRLTPCSSYHAGYGAANDQYNYGAYGNHSSERLTVNYHDVDQPGTPSKEYYPPNSPQPARRSGGGKKKWWVIGGLVAILVIAGAVVGGIVGSHKSTSNATAASSGSGSSTGSTGGAVSGGGGAGTASGNPTSQAFALPALDARGNPIYVRSAAAECV